MPRTPWIRIVTACGLVSLWLALLLAGVALAGGVHLLLGAALVLMPWRSLLR